MSNFGGSGGGQEVELNITPIIDCFTVLITFLLASASFLSVGFFEVNTPGQGSDPSASEPDTEAVIKIKNNHMAELKVKGKKNLTMTFDLNDKNAMKGIDTEIQKLQAEQLKLNQVLLSAEDEVDYQSVSEVMGHLSKSKLPVVVGDF